MHPIAAPKQFIFHSQEHFKLGIWSSATDFTVETVVPMLEEAAGPGKKLFQNPELILHRGHCQLAPPEHVKKGGKEWDTVKPLQKFFKHMDRVLLVDDDEFKVLLQAYAKVCIGLSYSLLLDFAGNTHS